MGKTPPGRGLPGTSDRLYDDDEREFLDAVLRWREAHKFRNPTLCELLAIARSLGWKKPEPEEEP